MKLKYTFEVMELDGEVVAVPVGDNATEFRGIIKLNESAAAIFELLKEETTEEIIVTKLASQFSSDISEIKAYVSDFIKVLQAEGVLE